MDTIVLKLLLGSIALLLLIIVVLLLHFRTVVREKNKILVRSICEAEKYLNGLERLHNGKKALEQRLQTKSRKDKNDNCAPTNKKSEKILPPTQDTIP